MKLPLLPIWFWFNSNPYYMPYKYYGFNFADVIGFHFRTDGEIALSFGNWVKFYKFN